MYIIYGLALLVLITTLILAVPTIRFLKDKRTEKDLWEQASFNKIIDFGVVKNLSVLPLIDYYTDNQELAVEPGVAYLITADDTKILFDVGYNKKNEHPSPLLRNMEKLGIVINDLDYIYISHLHRDHIGGTGNEGKRTFSLSGEDPDIEGLEAFVPVAMNHPSAEIKVISGPQILSQGIASIGPIYRSLWLMGMTAEQSLAINVEGKGIVLIVGCGHQKIERIIKRTEELFNIPVYGILGGLHYPVTVSRMPFKVQQIFATGKLPWQRITKEEVEYSLTMLKSKNLGLVGLSAHDSCDWTLNLFRRAFGPDFREIRVGSEIIV